jgi:hypothetical protein
VLITFCRETERRHLTSVGSGRMTLKVTLKKYDVTFKELHKDKKKRYTEELAHMI